MAQKFYDVQKAAEVLGVSVEKVTQMREGQQLRAYRDGAAWKFKAEDVDQLAQKRSAAGESSAGETPEEDEGDVLLSEVELGHSGPGSSGTVIGMEPGEEPISGSNIDIRPGDHKRDDGKDSAPGAAGKAESRDARMEELDLTLEEDVTLEDSAVALSKPAPAGSAGVAGPGADSALDLSAKGEGLAEEDLVLSGSGGGSDITIGGDSGISLVDPADSGLSLEEPLELAGSGDESLELGEDDMLTLAEDANPDAPTQLKTDDDFLLTPLQDSVDEEDSESGSQVIALDVDSGEVPPTMVGAPSGPPMRAMLDEDLSMAPLGTLAAGSPLAGPGVMGGQSLGLAEGAPLAVPAETLPEAPYTAWNVLSLALCVLLLAFSGMMIYDLVRNMWSWGSPYNVNSSLMDTILGLFEK